MNNRKKILLRSSDLFGQENQNMFINIKVDNSYKEFRPDSFDNDFDLQKQFDTERNASRNFTIYGDVNSVFRNSGSAPVYVYQEVIPPSTFVPNNEIEVVSSTYGPGSPEISFTLNNGAKGVLIDTISTTDKGSLNLFGFEEGYYKVDLVNVDYTTIYLNTANFWFLGNQMFVKNLVRQNLVFFEDDGQFIPYGQDTEEIRADGSTFTVFNDFPFFYDIHWIKLPLEHVR